MSEIKNEVTLTQAPIIEYSVLENIGKEVDKKLAFLDRDLVVTEENKKEIKSLRAELKKERTKLDDARKAIKKAVNDPYVAFEEKLKSEALAKYDDADTKLKTKIDEIETFQKEQTINKAVEYFNEVQKQSEIDYVIYEDLNFNVTLGTKLIDLQTEIDKLFGRIKSDLEIIETQEHKERILVRYKQCVTIDNALSYAITSVVDEIEAENKLKEVVPIVEPVIEQKEVPQKVEVPTELKTMTFKVTGTLEQLKSVKGFLLSNGIAYE